MNLPSVLPTIGEAAILLVFGLFTIATVINSLPERAEHVQKLSPVLMSAIPQYNFFAPNPSDADYYLIYRDRDSDGDVSEWKASEEMYESPDRFLWLWNPYYLQLKVVFDGMQSLSNTIELDENELMSEDTHPIPENKRDVTMSVHYLTMLEYITSLSHSPDAEMTQFAVMRGSRSTEEFTPKFISDFHPIQ